MTEVEKDNLPPLSEFSSAGHNFGKYVMGNQNLILRQYTQKDKDNHETSPIMAIPYKAISMSTVAGKNEVAVELNNPKI